jgi:hypothetical protein
MSLSGIKISFVIVKKMYESGARGHQRAEGAKGGCRWRQRNSNAEINEINAINAYKCSLWFVIRGSGGHIFSFALQSKEDHL